MKRIKKTALMLLTVVTSTIVLTITSCERRPLEEYYSDTAIIPIGAVWSKANIDPQNVTVLFYNQSDGNLALEHRFENNNNRIQSHVNLPIGTYTVVLFNEIRDQITSVGIRGYQNLNTLEAYSKQNNYVKKRSQSDVYVSASGIFASTLIRNFNVTNNMVDYTQGRVVEGETESDLLAQVEQLVGLTPLRKVSEIKVVLHVKGLNNSRMPALVDLRNLSTSYIVNADKNSTELSTHQFTMNNRTYDPGSNRNGTISGVTTTFGVVGDRTSIINVTSPIILDILFMLVDADKTLINRVVDITNMIAFSADNNGTIVIEAYIELTDPLPDVVPDGSTGDSGFNPDLTDWDVIEVPLTE